MTNGIYDVEILNPTVDFESLLDPLLDHKEGLTGAQAAAFIEQHSDKTPVLRERGTPTAADLEALRDFEIRTGKRLERI